MKMENAQKMVLFCDVLWSGWDEREKGWRGKKKVRYCWKATLAEEFSKLQPR